MAAKYISLGDLPEGKGEGKFFYRYPVGTSRLRWIGRAAERTCDFAGEKKIVYSCVAIDLAQDPPRVVIADLKKPIADAIRNHERATGKPAGGKDGFSWSIERTGSGKETTKYNAVPVAPWPVPEALMPQVKEMQVNLDKVASGNEPEKLLPPEPPAKAPVQTQAQKSPAPVDPDMNF